MESYMFYQNAVKHLDGSIIAARVMSTEMVKNSSDLEYLAKLHCIRSAFQYMFKVITFLLATPMHRLGFSIEIGGIYKSMGCWYRPSSFDWFVVVRRCGSRRFSGWLWGDAFFLQNQSNWPAIEKELEQRNAKSMNFYDVVLDCIVLDAFRDFVSCRKKSFLAKRLQENGMKIATIYRMIFKYRYCSRFH